MDIGDDDCNGNTCYFGTGGAHCSCSYCLKDEPDDWCISTCTNLNFSASCAICPTSCGSYSCTNDNTCLECDDAYKPSC